jgi:hypothetical protein
MKDPIRSRRNIAIAAALNAFFIFPYVVIYLHVSDALGASLLTYMASLTAAPVGAYLFACHKREFKHVDTSQAVPAVHCDGRPLC